jgi:hypothetical protein
MKIYATLLKESLWSLFNRWIFAVPLCSKLVGIDDVGVNSGCDSLRRLPRKHPGELVHLWASSFDLGIIYSSLSPSTAVHRRSRAHRSKIRWPKSGGACTVVIILLFRNWCTKPFHSIRLKSSNLKIICEFLSWWHHGLPHHPVWPGQMLMWQLTRLRSHWSVSVGKFSLGTKCSVCYFKKNPENSWNLEKSYLIRSNSEKYKWYIKMILKRRSIYFCYNISYLCTIILSEILKHD